MKPPSRSSDEHHSGAPDEIPVLIDPSTGLEVALWLGNALLSGVLGNRAYDVLKPWFDRKGPSHLSDVKSQALAQIDQQEDLTPEARAKVRNTIDQIFQKLERDL